MKIRMCVLGVLLALPVSIFAAESSMTFSNQWLKAGFTQQGGTWRLSSLSRLNGKDALAIADDGFEVLRFNGNRYTLDDYAVKDVAAKTDGDIQSIIFTCVPAKSGTDAPAEVALEYQLDKNPELHKTVRLKLAEGDRIDRLEVWRLSTDSKASRGGDNGQPVFVGDWFIGLDYPFFYSRHSDGFKQPAFHYIYHYSINLEGGDREYAPRNGLITVFHFPNKAKAQPGNGWGIVSKRGVIGLPAKPNDGAELALFDYIERTRPRSRSYLHFNNWYTPEAKQLTVDGFGTQLTKSIKEPLARYGARLDAMVPDDGWQEKNFTRIYEQSKQHEPLDKVAEAVRKQGVDFGIWVGMFGRGVNAKLAEKAGYRPAYPLDMPPMALSHKATFYDLTDENYQRDYKESMRWLIQNCGVRYIKHDFNYMFHTYAALRHAREEAADATLDMIAYERSLAPGLLINFTNGSMFTPFLLQHAEYMWMNSGDSGSNFVFPLLSKLEVATSYRDHHFYKSWGDPTNTVRPLIPIANFMTHGVLHAGKKIYFEKGDTLQDWCNYAVMYVGRGTLLKELYISPSLFTEPMWEALGKACAWSQANTDLLRNSWFIGGDCDQGEPYGYISWNGNRALLTVRNPDRLEKPLTVPFDRTVYYRGETGKPFRAKAIYPFTEQMPWKLTSGQPFTLQIPGDSVMVFELEAGLPQSTGLVAPSPLPAFSANTNGKSFEITLTVPDEEALRYDLVVLTESAKPAKPASRKDKTPMDRAAITVNNAAITVNNAAVEPQRDRAGTGFVISSFDLRPYRGQQIVIKGGGTNNLTLRPAVWLVCDRPVKEPAPPENRILPMQISRGYRHQSQLLIAPEK